MDDEPMTDQQRFETTSLPLAASLLSSIQNAELVEISRDPSVDGKRLLIIGYPSTQTQAVNDLVNQFHSRRLVVSLYRFNRVLNALRDRLKQDASIHAP